MRLVEFLGEYDLSVYINIDRIRYVEPKSADMTNVDIGGKHYVILHEPMEDVIAELQKYQRTPGL